MVSQFLWKTEDYVKPQMLDTGVTRFSSCLLGFVFALVWLLICCVPMLSLRNKNSYHFII